MTDINEQPSWEESISLISRSEKVEGGQDGPANRATKQLANRTLFLKQKQDNISDDLAGKVSAINDFSVGATLESPRDEILYGTYRLVWTGEFPKAVPAESSPETTGGVGAGRWAYTSDAEIRSNLGSNEDGFGASMLAAKQPFIDAVARTQREKNAESISIMDFGGDRDGFDPSDYEEMAKARANAARRPYLGAQQFALPYQTLKVWKYLDGYRDRGAVASFSNISSPDAGEPSTAVLGLTSAAGLGEYADRDAVGLFIRMAGQPALLVTSNTTFTANTLTSVDIASKIEHMRAGQIIDVTSASNSSILYSGLITDIDEITNTVTVDTAWYLKGGKGSTGIPPNGSIAAFVPNTKIWGQNINVHLNENSYATRMAGFEMGLYNNKVGGNGYGYDAYSGGSYSVGQGFQTRGEFNIGFAAYSGTKYGFVAYSSSIHGFYSSSSSVGMMSQNGSYSFIAKNPSLYSFLQQTSSNGFVTGIDSNGAWQGLKYYHRTVSIGDKITQYTTVAYVTPSSSSDVIYLPDIAYEKTITIRNLSKNYAVYLSGPYEYGAGGVTLPAMSAITLHCDSTYWYKIGGFSAS